MLGDWIKTTNVDNLNTSDDVVDALPVHTKKSKQKLY